jgi:Flp pilus assembly protein TadG
MSRSHRSDDRGVAMIEFALIAPLLIMLLVGIVEFGRGYSAKVRLTGAARDGARSVALRQPIVPQTDITFTINSSCPAGDTTSDARVTASTTFTYDIPFFRSETKTLSETGVMRCGG